VAFRRDRRFLAGKAFVFNGFRHEPMHRRDGMFYAAYGPSGSAVAPPMNGILEAVTPDIQSPRL
jgi:hypothetical protein